MKKTITILALAVSSFANADIFEDVAKIEKLDSADTSKLDAINTKEYISPVFYVGEDNPRFELSDAMKSRKDNLTMRLENPDAWKMYKDGIDEFSYFGFKLYDVEQGRLSMQEFLTELQKYLER